ncbi:hypothetical protein N8D56_00140 [Devosia sp. A8/3-2]|nr:hypothetical protein N8D56_00140 [Devosia sp. A8/3-2]
MIIRRNKLLSFAVALVALRVLGAIFAPVLGLQDPYARVIVQRMKGPNWLNFRVPTNWAAMCCRASSMAIALRF